MEVQTQFSLRTEHVLLLLFFLLLLQLLFHSGGIKAMDFVRSPEIQLFITVRSVSMMYLAYGGPIDISRCVNISTDTKNSNKLTKIKTI